MADTPKRQRIKLRIYKHPVKWDATIIAVAPDGEWMDIEFDGPIPAGRFWQYGEKFLADKKPIKPLGGSGMMPDHGTLLWEVL